MYESNLTYEVGDRVTRQNAIECIKSITQALQNNPGDIGQYSSIISELQHWGLVPNLHLERPDLQQLLRQNVLYEGASGHLACIHSQVKRLVDLFATVLSEESSTTHKS